MTKVLISSSEAADFAPSGAGDLRDGIRVNVRYPPDREKFSRDANAPAGDAGAFGVPQTGVAAIV